MDPSTPVTIFIAENGNRQGPYSIHTLKEMIRRGDISLSDKAWYEGCAEWTRIRDMPELLDAIIPPLPPPQEGISPHAPTTSDEGTKRGKGVALTSAVLGMFALIPGLWLAFQLGLKVWEPNNDVRLVFMLSCLAIPGIICGHIARRYLRSSPQRYGGSQFALTGLSTGYLSILITLGFTLPACARAKERAQTLTCANNMKQLILASLTWAIDNDSRFPFNVSKSQGGSMELCLPGPNGFDYNPFTHLMIMSNELETTHILVCPADSSRRWSVNWQSLQSSNVSYLIHVGTKVDQRYPDEVLAVCPIHGHAVLCNGRVQLGPRFRHLADDPSFKKYTKPLPASLLHSPQRP